MKMKPRPSSSGKTSSQSPASSKPHATNWRYWENALKKNCWPWTATWPSSRQNKNAPESNVAALPSTSEASAEIHRQAAGDRLAQFEGSSSSARNRVTTPCWQMLVAIANGCANNCELRGDELAAEAAAQETLRAELRAGQNPHR